MQGESRNIDAGGVGSVSLSVVVVSGWWGRCPFACIPFLVGEALGEALNGTVHLGDDRPGPDTVDAPDASTDR